MTMFQLKDNDLDELRELLNIGVSHAGTTLSQLLSRRVTVSVPNVAVRNAETISSLITHPNELLLSVLLRISGGVDGYVFVIFPHDAATHLLSALSGKTIGDLRALNSFDHSVFQEVGNVLTGGMLHGLSRFLHLNLMHSVPNVVVDMGGAMLNSVAVSMVALHEEFLSLNVAICVDATKDSVVCGSGEETRGEMFLFLGPEAVARILEVTGKIAKDGQP